MVRPSRNSSSVAPSGLSSHSVAGSIPGLVAGAAAVASAGLFLFRKDILFPAPLWLILRLGDQSGRCDGMTPGVPGYRPGSIVHPVAQGF